MDQYQFITKQDEEKISDFVAHYAKYFFAIPNFPLYHYTTGENFINIIKSNALWATQAACLNDTTEITYAINSLLQSLRKKIATHPNENALYILNRMHDALLSPNIETSPVFVACFSQSKDDLSQWRAYSGHEGGYSIEFDASKLRSANYSLDKLGESKARVLLARVEYDPTVHSQILDNLIDWTTRFFLELDGAKNAQNLQQMQAWADEFCRYWLNHLAVFSSCIKNPAFKSEQEWRLIYIFGPDAPKWMQFRQKQSMMTRHIPLHLQLPMPISGVIVGPCRHPQLSKVAVGDLLLANGLDPNIVNIQSTEIPYRIT